MKLNFTWDQIRSFRLQRHALLERAPRRRLCSIVESVAGIQAQLPAAAYLSLWARVEGITPTEIDKAVYKRKSLARTWCMRGTVHIVSSRDRTLFSTALGTRVGGLKSYLLRRGYLTEKQYDILHKAVLEALEDQPLDRRGIAQRISKTVPDASNWFGSWGGIVRILSQDGLVVFGPPQGSKSTFARADRWWQRDEQRLEYDDPLLELMRRYLHGFGPATPGDFAYWSGLTVREGRALLEKLSDEVAEISADGKNLFIARRDLRKLRKSQPVSSARLLPHFDVYLLGHRDKSQLLDPGEYKRVFRQAGWISPTILLNGRIAGTWSHDFRGTKLVLSFDPFGSLPRWARSELRREAESLRSFLGAKQLTIHS